MKVTVKENSYYPFVTKANYDTGKIVKLETEDFDIYVRASSFSSIVITDGNVISTISSVHGIEHYNISERCSYKTMDTSEYKDVLNKIILISSMYKSEHINRFVEMLLTAFFSVKPYAMFRLKGGWYN